MPPSFLNEWLIFFADWRRRGRPISAAEHVSRSVFEQSKLKSDSLHFRAFLPSVAESSVSISRVTGLSDPQVWFLGDRAGRPRRKPVIGRGDLSVVAVNQCRLVATFDVPPRRHALLSGWPAAADLEARKNVAQLLSSEAKLRVRSEH